MPKETTLRLENYFLAFIEDQIAKGRFSSPSAVVQAGLRLLEESEFSCRSAGRRVAGRRGQRLERTLRLR